MNGSDSAQTLGPILHRKAKPNKRARGGILRKHFFLTKLFNRSYFVCNRFVLFKEKMTLLISAFVSRELLSTEQKTIFSAQVPLHATVSSLRNES